MREILIPVLYLVASFLFIYGIKGLGSPLKSVKANQLSALGMLLAIVATLLVKEIVSFEYILIGLVVGSGIGALLAYTVKMTDMPQMVGLLNGFGGGASAIVAFAELLIRLHNAEANPSQIADFLNLKSGLTIQLSIIIGGVTFTGSLIAFGKLQGLITGKVVKLPGHNFINIFLLLGALGLIVFSSVYPDNMSAYYISLAISLILGVMLVMPIGGADMPVAISLLNSYSGLAAAATGFVINNEMLIIAGALVGASGVILTNIMCKAMNRSLMNVLLGGWANAASTDAADQSAVQKSVKSVDSEEAAMLFSVASNVVIVPGYGMAVAQAQHAVKELMDNLEKKGVNVRFAIHPVAGRMPGHMNILLAEANIPYDKLLALEDINDDFKNTDISLIIGANDVVNPAARNNPQSTIYGMPILNVDYSKTVVIIKRSMASGYAGIENELFYNDNSLMYFGDAKDALVKLNNELKNLLI